MIPIQSVEDLQDLNSQDVRKIMELTAKFPENKRRLIGQLLLLPKREQVQDTHALDKALGQLEKEMGLTKKHGGGKPRDPNSARSLAENKLRAESKVSREDLIQLLMSKRGWHRSQAANNLDNAAYKNFHKEVISGITYYSLKS